MLTKTKCKASYRIRLYSLRRSRNPPTKHARGANRTGTIASSVHHCNLLCHATDEAQVDHTTLGRPAQKRKGVANAVSDPSNSGVGPEARPSTDDPTFVDETAEKDLEDFLMSHPDGERAYISEIKHMRPTKMEMSTSLLSPFHLLTALLERDKHFASSMQPENPCAQSIVDLIDDSVAAALDQWYASTLTRVCRLKLTSSSLVWYRLIYPDIPHLPTLRKRIGGMHILYPNRHARLFLLNLLSDLAIDVPSASLASYRHLQPKIRAMLSV